MSFQRFQEGDLVISSEKVVQPAWTGGVTSLTGFYTSSLQSTNPYYLDVYNANPNSSVEAEVQFSIAYGNKLGSGSIPYNSAVVGKSPSATIYGQCRALLLESEEVDFTFGDFTSDRGVYIISVARGRFKERLKPESFVLSLEKSGDGNSLVLYPSTTPESSTATDVGEVYSLINPMASEAGRSQYGKLYPNLGIILLSVEALEAGVTPVINLGTFANTSNTTYRNVFLNTLKTFSLQSEETITSNFIFTRVKNGEFNYSMNPTLTTSTGEIRELDLVDMPRTYITTVGLYNDSNELLAVAKLSTPLQKDFTKEALLRVKLDY